jgi:chromosome segregation ATPase
MCYSCTKYWLFHRSGAWGLSQESLDTREFTALIFWQGPLINFMVGENGSGKSAVLTAVTLCLGGKAAATNRGASLKSLIRSGQEQAHLAVRLKNEGADAYQPETYGDSIIVERHFSRSGSSGYKLRNSNGRTVSTKKGDVDDIIEYFNLQVDNPMNVLTQDAAKSFIQNSTPSTKYKFFVEGVQLQQLDSDYRLVSDTCDLIEAKLEEAKGDIKILERKYKAAAEKKTLIDQHQGTKEAAARLRDQLVWVQIEDQEARLARREASIAAAQAGITEAETTAEEKDHAFQKVNLAVQSDEETVQRMEDLAAPLTEEVKVAKEAHDEARKKVEEVHTEQRDIKQSLAAAQKRVEDWKASISEEQRRIEEANGGSHSRKLAELEEARTAATEAKEEMDNSEAKGLGLDEALGRANDDLKKAEALLNSKRDETDESRKRLHDLRTNQPNVMDGYDRNMPRLLQAIRNDRGFREQPVGPMGLHIRLLRPMWSNMIEAYLGRSLNAFVVTSKADQMRLASILRQFKMEICPIFIGNHHHIDTTGNEPDTQYETILRVLEIDNELVRSQLIIHHGIEQCLLIRKREDASRVMYHGPKPRNTKCAFALHDSRRDAGHRLGYTGRNNTDEDMGPVRYLNQKPRMNTDAESQINLQADILTSLEREKNELERRCTQLRLAKDKCQTAINNHKRSLRDLKAALQRAELRVEDLETELDKDNVEDGRLEVFRTSLAEAENEVGVYKETYMNSVNEKDNLNTIATAKKRELEAVKARVAEHESELKKAQIKLRNRGQARRLVLEEKNAAIERIEDLRRKVVALEAERDAQAAVVEDHTKQAIEICQRVRVPEGETRDSLETKFKRLNERIKAYRNKLGGSEEEITLALEEALAAYQRATNHYTDMEELLTILKLSFQKRMEGFWRFQRYISAASRIAFSYLLSNRGFRGKLLIDHQARKLDVHVEPDETTKSSKGRQTKTLSGGEKSFSSICLLLALWEAMGSPLRCLDEYDVFMDDVNRDVSTKMIVTYFLSFYT